MFAELEEVIEYKFSDDNRKADIRETWKKRWVLALVVHDCACLNCAIGFSAVRQM